MHLANLIEDVNSLRVICDKYPSVYSKDKAPAGFHAYMHESLECGKFLVTLNSLPLSVIGLEHNGDRSRRWGDLMPYPRIYTDVHMLTHNV